jgi:hypothetical protein
MSTKCDVCQEVVYRRIFSSEAKKFVGVDCGCIHLSHGRNSCQDPFAGLTLEHVHGPDGKPMHFENLRALSRWENETGQVHAVLSHGERWMPSDWTPPTMPQLMRPREQRDHGRMVNTVDGHRVISGNGFTARVRRG